MDGHQMRVIESEKLTSEVMRCWGGQVQLNQARVLRTRMY